jgi:diacylglycerol kinase family enzyme
MRRLVLIANPAASAFTSALYRDIVHILTGPFDVTTVWPAGAAESRQAAADAAAEGYDVVVAMGGDGVAHQAAGALAGTSTALGIVPAGTTNVLGRMLGLPVKPRAAAERIALGSVRPVAMARLDVAGPDVTANDVAMFAAGMGFDAAVVERAEREPLRKIWFGPLHYARSAAAVALGPYRTRLPHLRVEAHGRRADAVTVIVQIHEAWTYFGPLQVSLAPKGTLPGMTVLVVERMGLRRTLGMAARSAARRELSRMRGVQVWQGVERLRIEADPPAWIQADGELLGRASRLMVDSLEEPLLVVA